MACKSPQPEWLQRCAQNSRYSNMIMTSALLLLLLPPHLPLLLLLRRRPLLGTTDHRYHLRSRPEPEAQEATSGGRADAARAASSWSESCSCVWVRARA